MPAPYSDNLYSDPDPAVSESHGGRDDDDASAAATSALSPSDGYFHASPDDDFSPTSYQPQHHNHHRQPTHPSHRSSASGPYVPNVLVEDPTLSSDPDTKAKLAHHLINNDAAPAPSSSSPHPHHNPESYYPSASPSVSGASIATPSTITTASYTQLPGRQLQSPQQFPAQNRQLHINTSPPIQPSNYNHNGQADAPPAYTPSSPDNNPSHYNYSTFPSVTSPRMGVPEEHDRLLSPQQQQPFGDPPKQPLWQRIKDSHDSGSLRNRIKRILGILVFVSIILVFLGFNMSGPEYRKHIIDKSPIRIPDMNEREMEWHPSKLCRDSPHNYPKETFHADLASDRVLLIEQTIRKNGWNSPGGPMPHVNGEVILRPTSDGKAALDVEIITNYEDMDIDVEFDTRGHTDHLKITTPRLSPDASRDACIQIRVTAWIPQKAIVNALAVNTVSLNLFVQEGLAMGAENSVDFVTVSGNVVLPDDDGNVEPYKIESPGYKYTTVSGDVKGWFPMYHKLKINTVSGDVSAQVKHKDIVLSSNMPSLLEVTSVSGALTVGDGSEESSYDVPARDHLVKFSTTSGDVVAKVYTGSSSEFSSTSGDLQLDLLPVLDERWLRSSWRPLLKTFTTSGSHRVTVKEPFFVDIPNELYPGRRPNLPKTEQPEEPSEPKMESTSAVADADDGPETQDIKRRRVAKNNRGLTALESRHNSISGNMRLFYPASWEGTFSASSMSSDISVRGKDVVVEKKRGGLITKEVSGHKGDGSSSLKIDELSGNVIVWIGQ